MAPMSVVATGGVIRETEIRGVLKPGSYSQQFGTWLPAAGVKGTPKFGAQLVYVYKFKVVLRGISPMIWRHPLWRSDHSVADPLHDSDRHGLERLPTPSVSYSWQGLWSGA